MILWISGRKWLQCSLILHSYILENGDVSTPPSYAAMSLNYDHCDVMTLKHFLECLHHVRHELGRSIASSPQKYPPKRNRNAFTNSKVEVLFAVNIPMNLSTIRMICLMLLSSSGMEPEYRLIIPTGEKHYSDGVRLDLRNYSVFDTWFSDIRCVFLDLTLKSSSWDFSTPSSSSSESLSSVSQNSTPSSSIR